MGKTYAKKKFVPLSTSQWTLHNYLITKYKEDSSHYVSKEEIAEDLKVLYPRYIEKSEPVNSTVFRQIRADIEAIRSNPVVQKIFISNSKGYKVATKKEAEDYFAREKAKHRKALALISKQVKKAKLDGQYRMNLGLKEKTVVEAFFKED